MQSFNRLLCFSYAGSLSTITRRLSTRSPHSRGPPSTGLDEWNDAWETAWLPNDDAPAASTGRDSQVDRAPWESGELDKAVHGDSLEITADLDGDTKAFVAEMDDRWNERRVAKKVEAKAIERMKEEKVKGKRKGDEYRIKKQRIHAGLWVKEIEKLEEARLGGGTGGGDIDRLLDSCAEIFDSGNNELCETVEMKNNELKTKPDGWESTSKNPNGDENIWDISQREEDILLQEFERRIAFTKFQIGSFLKTHIFSRRRPIDGWKYMIEEIGPNARKGKGSVQRLPSLTDPTLQPFKEEKASMDHNNVNSSSFTRR